VTSRSLSPTDLKRLHRGWRRRTEGRLALVLDGVMTPVNVGSILRLAAAYGASPVWLAGATAPASHPGARKTAMGTERFVDVVEGMATREAIGVAREDGFRVVGIELASAAVPLHELPLAGDTCVVVGNEDHGLSAGALGACDALAYLPLVGKVGSLNVATAAAIALYEVRRREWAAPVASGGR
jgi:tRNA (guanosine-2'-O-)-methyltransferase